MSLNKKITYHLKSKNNSKFLLTVRGKKRNLTVFKDNTRVNNNIKFIYINSGLNLNLKVKIVTFETKL